MTTDAKKPVVPQRLKERGSAETRVVTLSEGSAIQRTQAIEAAKEAAKEAVEIAAAAVKKVELESGQFRTLAAKKLGKEKKEE
jgi:hypothetical protein